MTSETFNVYEAAKQLGVSSSWVRVLLWEGRIAGAEKIDGQWRIPVETVNTLQSQRQTVSA